MDSANYCSYLNVYKIELTGSKVAEIANGTFEGKTPTPAHRPSRGRRSAAMKVTCERGGAEVRMRL